MENRSFFLGAPPLSWWAAGLLAAGASLLVLLGVLLWVRRAYRPQQHALGSPAEAPGDAPLAEAPGPGAGSEQMAGLYVKASREAATAELVQQGAAGLTVLRHALMKETDERRVQPLAQVCARMATPAARELLLEVAQADNLPARAAALRALDRFAPAPADAPVFQRLIEDEMRRAQHLLHGMGPATAELRTALAYELRQGRQRLFGLLLQVYERPVILEAQRLAAHPVSSRPDAALELLDTVVSRPLYRGMRALLDGGPLSSQVQTFDGLLGSPISAEPVQNTVVRQGLAAFSAWAIGVALRQWHPHPATVAYLHPHLHSANPLIRESALALLRQLPERRPAAYDQLLTLYPALIPLLMNSPAPTACVSAQERVLMLKGTALFAETPEPVLGTIIPIMKEVAFEPEQVIFTKGTLGTSLFIVCDGEVGIFDGAQQLATFRKGDFFGELALLDAEPRSATAVAQGRVVTFRLDQEDFYDVMEERPEVLRNILRVLCQRLRHQNEAAQVAH